MSRLAKDSNGSVMQAFTPTGGYVADTSAFTVEDLGGAKLIGFTENTNLTMSDGIPVPYKIGSVIGLKENETYTLSVGQTLAIQ